MYGRDERCFLPFKAMGDSILLQQFFVSLSMVVVTATPLIVKSSNLEVDGLSRKDCHVQPKYTWQLRILVTVFC